MKSISVILFACCVHGLAFGAEEATTHRGTGKTSEIACQAARQLASSEGIAAGECRCQFNGRVHICMSDSVIGHGGAKGPIAIEFTPVKPGKRVIKPQTTRPKQCDDLIRYRDTSLVSDIDSAIRGYAAARDSLDVLRPLRQELNRARLVHPTIDLAHKLTLEVKTSANLIQDMLGMSTVAGAAANATTGLTAALLSSKTEGSVALMTGEINSWLIAEATALVPGIGPTLKMFYNLHENLDAIASNEVESKATIDTIDRNVAQLERLFRKQEALLNDSRTQAKLINKVKAEIDRKCG